MSRAWTMRVVRRSSSSNGTASSGRSFPTGLRPTSRSCARWWKRRQLNTRRKTRSRLATARRKSKAEGEKWGGARASPFSLMSAVPKTAAAAYLAVSNIEVIYDHVILVLKGVSLSVTEGQIVALLGANGAGKTTTLKAISNLLGAERGDVTKGHIEFRGERIDRLNPSELVKRGVVQVMEGRHCFQHLSVEENLLTGAYTRGSADLSEDLEKVYRYFPRLKQRRKAQAGYTSGGEQQMTAIGRALMARPQTILLDEPSMGLAPQLVEEIFEIVKDLNQKEKVSFLLAEQNTHIALRYADYGYILENGRVVMDGEAKDLAQNEDVKEFYLGFSTAGRKSFRDVKSYRRRKRWL